MTRTVADHSRDYRKRKAEKLARYEAALIRAAQVMEWLAVHRPDCFGFEAPFPSTTPCIRVEAEVIRKALSPDAKN